MSRTGQRHPHRLWLRLLVAASGMALGVAVLAAGPASAATKHATHTVQTGENLTTIAERYGVSTADLITLNHLADPNHLLVGRILLLPSQSRSSSASASSDSSASDSSSSDASPTVENQPWFTLTAAQRRAVSRELTRAAHEFGVSVSLLKALTYTESRWRQDVVSVTGAIGVGQLLPSTAAWLAQLMGEPDLSPYVRKDNIRMSAFLLRWLLDHTHSRRAAIASYYQGVGAVLQTGVSDGGALYASTVSYRRIWFF